MNQGRTLFAQLLDHAPHTAFRRCVERYGGNHRVRSFTCWDQFLCMAFAQLTYRESLRDIEACLNASPERLYHMGIRGTVSRSTLADANERRDWRIYADFAQVLIRDARRLYAGEPLGFALQGSAYAFDSTTIDLCLALFPWARFRSEKAGIKLHTLLDLHGSIPTFIHLSGGRVNDVNGLDELPLEPGALYVLDRGYFSLIRLLRVTRAGASFVIRAKKNLGYSRRYSHPVDRSTGLVCDQTIVLSRSSASYPDPLRRVRIRDAEKQKTLVFLSNNFQLPALTIAEIYRYRWRIELFFRWIKQHLRIKAFYGTSANAVKTQIWIAISVYVLVAIIAKRLNVRRDLYTILQILSVTLFEKIELSQALDRAQLAFPEECSSNQLLLFNF
jgi:transposase